MIDRRSFLAAGAWLAGVARAGQAQSVPSELTLAVAPGEDTTATIERFGPLADYLGQQISIPVKLRVAHDYVSVIEAQRANNVQIAWYGSGFYAQAVRSGVKIEPLVNEEHASGLNGYYSVLWVRADSPYRSVEDLKGKTLALVSPDSTPGNNAPRYFLAKQKHILSLEGYFGRVFYAGSHQNTILAVAQGMADVAANEYFSDTDSPLTRMADKHLIKDASGKELTPRDFRVVFKSTLLPEGPLAVLSSLPPELRLRIRQALLDLPQKNKKVFDDLFGGKDLGLLPVTQKDYEPTLKLLEYVDSLRKRL